MSITFIRTGEGLNLKDVIYSQKVFYGSGFYMIKMGLIHEWIILVLVYSIGLAKSIKKIKFLEKSQLQYNQPRICMCFVLSYYQGRSDNEVFPYVTWPAFIIFALFVYEYLHKIKGYFKDHNDISVYKKVDLFTYLAKAACALLLLICFSLSFLHNAMNNEKLIMLENKTNISQEQNVATTVANYVISIRENNEPIDLIMSYSAIVYSILDDKNIANVPATVDWFTKEDYKKVIKWISETENKIIFDLNSYNLLKQYCNEELNEILEEKFILKENTGELLFFEHK